MQDFRNNYTNHALLPQLFAYCFQSCALNVDSHVAKDLFKQMAQLGISLTFHKRLINTNAPGVKTLMQGIACNNRETRHLKKINSFYTDLSDTIKTNRDWHHLEILQDFVVSSSFMTSHIYNLLVFCRRSKGDPKGLIDFIKDVKTHSPNFTLDQSNWNSLISTSCHLLNSLSILKVFEEMLESGIQPNNLSFYPIINLLLSTGIGYEKLIDIFQLMNHYAVPIDVEIFVAFLRFAHTHKKQFRNIDNLLTQFESLNIQPDIRIFDQFLKMYARNGNVYGIQKVVEKIHISNLRPSIYTLQFIHKSFDNIQYSNIPSQQARELLSPIINSLEFPIIKSTSIDHHLKLQVIQSTDSSTATRILDMILNNTHFPSVALIQTLIHSFSTHSDFAATLSLITFAKQHNLILNSRVFRQIYKLHLPIFDDWFSCLKSTLNPLRMLDHGRCI